ncbi:MAG: hypothetical protein Q8N83_04075 [Ignavibacteria bacterium]|nr:hypothetical protein [Ignavibacteria bacterium]
MNKKLEIEKLAKILSEVHGHCYRPFYESGGETSEELNYSWDKLSEKSLNLDDVDKIFFREMATKIIDELRNK